MLSGFTVDTFTETEAGLYGFLSEKQRKKRGKRLCRAGNVLQERERERERMGFGAVTDH